MDPDTAYREMFEAMRDGDCDRAREHALALRLWLTRGGFTPAGYTRVAVVAYVNNVLRRTASGVIDKRIIC